MVKVKATLIKTNKVFSSKRGYKSAIVTMKVAGSSIICCFSDVGFFLIGILFCYTIIVQNSATTCWLVGSLARWHKQHSAAFTAPTAAPTWHTLTGLTHGEHS